MRQGCRINGRRFELANCELPTITLTTPVPLAAASALLVLSETPVNLSSVVPLLHPSSCFWEGEGKDDVLEFIQENAKLKMIAILFGHAVISNEELAFASEVAEAASNTTHVTNFAIDLQEVEEDSLEDACRAIEACSAAVTELSVGFRGTWELATAAAHDKFIRLAKLIGAQQNLKSLSIHQVPSIVFEPLIRFLGTTPNWEHMNEFCLRNPAEPLDLSLLNQFLTSKAAEVKSLRIDAFDTIFDVADTTHIINTLSQNTNMMQLCLRGFMDEKSHKLFAQYLTSSHCRLKTLHLLVLRWARFHAVPALASNRTLEELILRLSTDDGQYVSATLQEILTRNKSLRVLRVCLPRALESNLLHGALSGAFWANSTLKTLDLFGEKQPRHLFDFSPLGKALKDSQCLEELKLRQFTLSSADMTISEFISNLPSSLKSLYLDCHNLFDDKGTIDSLFEGIGLKKSLRRMHIHEILQPNEPLFVKALAEALPNVGLTHLSFNVGGREPWRCDPKAMQALVEGLKSNESLESLVIGPEVLFDRSIHTKLQQQCISNRLGNLCKSIANGGIPISAVPGAMLSIQKGCTKYDIDPELQQKYSTTVLHSLLKVTLTPGTHALDRVFEYLRSQPSCPAADPSNKHSVEG